MATQRTIRFLAGPAATLALLAAIHQWPYILGATAALAFLPLVWAAYVAGIWPALISAGVIAGFAVHFYLPDYNRIIQITVASFAVAVMVGELKHRALLSDTLNGNLRRLREAIEITDKLIINWSDLSDRGRYRQVELIKDRLGNMATLVFGWLKIGQEMKEAKQAVSEKSKAVAETEQPFDAHRD